MGNAEDKQETEGGTMSMEQSVQKDGPPNLNPVTVSSNGSETDNSSTVVGTKTEEICPNACEDMDTSEAEPMEGPPELQPYDLYEGPDFSETFDADAFDSIGLNSMVDNDFENDGRDTPELHLYDTATDEDFEGSNYSFTASGDGSLFNQSEITNEISNEGQSIFTGIKSESEEQSKECSMLLEDHDLDIEEKQKASNEEQEDIATEQDRTGDNLIEKKDNQDESKEGDSLVEKKEESEEDKEEKKQEVEEKEEEKPRVDVDLDTFSAILATRSITHKVLADIASEWISGELKEVDQESMPEVFQVPTSQSTWQLLSGERIYTRERQKKMMCRRSKRKRIGVNYKETDPLYNCGKYEKVKRDKRFTANPWKKTVPAVDDDGKLNCRMCKFVCDTYTAFHQHLLDNHTWKKCTKCNFLTMSQRKMKAHIKIMHAPKGKVPQECHLCGLITESDGRLQEHMLYYHKCYICSFTAMHKVDLDRHMDVLHKGSPKLKPPKAKIAHLAPYPGSVMASGTAVGSAKVQAGPSTAPTQTAVKAYPLTNDMLRKPPILQRPNVLTQQVTLPQASAPATQLSSTRTQPITTVLGQPAVAHPVVQPGMVTVPQQVAAPTAPLVVRLQNQAEHMETFIRCSFCSFLFSTANAAHSHMANVHWRQLAALAQTGQKVVLQKVFLYTNAPQQHKAQPNPNTVRHLLNNKGDAASASSHQKMQKETIVVNPSGPAPLTINTIVRPPVVGTVNAMPAIRQGFQAVQASPSPVGITPHPGTPVIRQQLQPNLVTPVQGTSTNMAPVGSPQQILVLKKEGDKFVWVAQSAQNIPNLLPNQNKVINVANVTTASQTVTSQNTVNVVVNPTKIASNAPVKNEQQTAAGSNQAAAEPKQSESVPKHTVATSQVTSTVVTQSVNSSSTTTTQHVPASLPSTVQTAGTVTSALTSTHIQSTVAVSSQQNPAHLSTIAAKSPSLPSVVSISISPPVTPSLNLGVSPTGQLALISQEKTSQPAKTVFYVNKAPQVGSMSAPPQVVTIQGTQTVQRVGSPVVNSGGIQPGAVGTSNTILVMPDGQRIVLPNNQKLVTVPATPPGGIIQQPKALPPISLAPPVEVSNSQFVMKNTNRHKGPRGYGVGMPYAWRMPVSHISLLKGQVQNIGSGQIIVPNNAGGLIVGSSTQPVKDSKADSTGAGQATFPLAPKLEPKSDTKDTNVVIKAKQPEDKQDAQTKTPSAKKGSLQDKKKSKIKAKVKTVTGKEKNSLSKKKQKKAKLSPAEDTETILLRSFHTNPYLTAKELQQLKFKTYRSASDIRYWFHNMQRKCMKSLEQREPSIVLHRCDAKDRGVEK